MKSLRFLGLMVLASAAMYGQPTTGAQYWSTTPPACASFDGSISLGGPVAITNAAGATVGYSCYVSGTFLWLAAGGPKKAFGDQADGSWGTSIRVAAPASGAVGVDYQFYDQSGNNVSLDTTSGSGLFPSSGSDFNFALNPNQPSEIQLLGATNNAPHYRTTQTGSIYATFYCPNAFTCETVLPQLLYSLLPTKPWSLSVPISWDGFFSSVQPQGAWPQWSATGVNDATHLVSLVVYNQDTVATAFTVRVYDGSGNLAGTGTTPLISPIIISSTSVGQGGTYGDLLSNIVKTFPTGVFTLPTGVFKVTVDGGSVYSAVSVLQFNGDSATSLQVAYDSSSTSGTVAPATAARQSIGRARVVPPTKQVFKTLPK